MYQLYAYGTKYKECKQMYLIYPKDKDAEEKKYNYLKNGGLELTVVFFDVQNKKFEDEKIEIAFNNLKQKKNNWY